MTATLERVSGFFPGVLALSLPGVFLTVDGDAYILPRASIVLAGACLGIGLALLIRPGPGLGRLRRPLALAAVAALLAFAFSVSHALSLAGSYSRYESLPMRLAYLGLLATSVYLLRTQRHRDWLVIGFVAGTSLASLEAVYQWANHASFRPDGNLGNANLLAALIAMAVPLALDRALRDRWVALAWAAAAAIMVAGLLTTTSRSGGLGVVAGCAVVTTLMIRPRRAAAAVAASGAAVLAAAIGFVVFGPLSDLNGDPPSLRINLWRDALHLVAARPITGWGEDTTGLVFGRYLSGDYATLVTFDRVHSGLLEIAATQGLVGLVALGWVLAVIAVAAWRHRFGPGVAGLAGALAGYSVWVFVNFDWAPATGAFWLLAGALWSAATSTPTSTDRPNEPAPTPAQPTDRPDDPRWWGAARPALAVLLALLAVVLGAFPILADAWYVRGQADLAVQLDPLQAQYHWALGRSLIAGGDLAGGTAELHRAADLGETDPGLYVELGDRESDLGERAAAKDAYRRALEIDPFYTPARQRLSGGGGG